ncbi:hypothetical protein GCM10027294_20010 [Marinactinospora endophytica]
MFLVRQLGVAVQVNVEPLDEREDLVNESHHRFAVLGDTLWIDRLRHCFHRLHRVRAWGAAVPRTWGAPPRRFSRQG